MVFCNVLDGGRYYEDMECHNPYFNRWFSAINKQVCYACAINKSQSLF